MLALTTCLLLATSALATDFDSAQQESKQPIDYNDDLHLRKNPVAGRIFFNFQQTRLDQPPQVEIRDEDVGRYMYRTRTTPVAFASTPRMPVEEINFNTDFSPFNNVQSQKRFPTVDIWRQQSTTRAPVPPTTRKWEEVSENFQVGQQPQYYPSQWYSQPSFVQTQGQSTVAPVEKFAAVNSRPSAPTFAPVVLPTRANRESQPVAQTWQEARPYGANRGNHKFNWDDVLLPLPPPDQKPETRTAPAAPTASAVRSTPAPYGPRAYPGGAPPVPPTLTSWQGDNLR